MCMPLCEEECGCGVGIDVYATGVLELDMDVSAANCGLAMGVLDTSVDVCISSNHTCYGFHFISFYLAFIKTSKYIIQYTNTSIIQENI